MLAEVDLKVEIYRTGVYSLSLTNEVAVRVTHIPTGTSVTATDERSVRKAHSFAMEELLKLLDAEGVTDEAHRDGP